eukprot:CCRYP_003299-RA/>CCRYP_003299-RA protein AED:0.41 eAED:0.41 QI:0/-1/0/1/-1/1/1/0/93
MTIWSLSLRMMPTPSHHSSLSDDEVTIACHKSNELIESDSMPSSSHSSASQMYSSEEVASMYNKTNFLGSENSYLNEDTSSAASEELSLYKRI